MKLFIDSADLEEIRKAKEWGVLDGVTTNPSLIKKAVQKYRDKNLDMKSYIKEILKTSKGHPVSLEVIGSTYDEMLREALKLYKTFNPVAKNVVIKIPVNPSLKSSDGKSFDGIRVIKSLSKKGIPVNCTLVFTPEQALLAAKAGAKFVSPFAGRVDDFIRKSAKKKFDKHDYFPIFGLNGKNDNGIVSGIDLVDQIVSIFSIHNITTEVLAASIRNSQQLRECAIVGSDIATIPFSVIKNLLEHKKTLEGMKKFTKDIVPEYADLLR